MMMGEPGANSSGGQYQQLDTQSPPMPTQPASSQPPTSPQPQLNATAVNNPSNSTYTPTSQPQPTKTDTTQPKASKNDWEAIDEDWGAFN